MASTTTRVAVSQILTSTEAETEDEEPRKKSREDWRKAKELEEARKAGTAPAAVDETGKDINPHIPQYISSAPWYYGVSGPTLKHQRPQQDREAGFTKLDTYYKKGVDPSSAVTKYRKGACENCGAMTHKKKDCLERPRKIGAKYSSACLAADEPEQPQLNLSFDGKRDRWNGYDPAEHARVLQHYQMIEEAKRELRAQKLDQNPEGVEGSGDEASGDEDKYVEGVDMPGTKVDSKQRITVRNLRIREDTAKYLRNLDPNSAYYDPKTRSMRDNPNPSADDNDYEGENFVRVSGDTQRHAVAQMFAWEAQGRGVDVHLLAEPTKLERLHNHYLQNRDTLKSQVKDSILEKYGGEEHLRAPPRALLLAQTEQFTQYNRDGTVAKGAEKQIARSRYEEDVLINNHTRVWGSWWRDGHWGYHCCHSTIKMSYCVGDAGKTVVLDATADHSAATTDHDTSKSKRADKNTDKTDESSSSSSDSNSSSESDSEQDQPKTEKTSKKKKNKKKARKKKKKDLKKIKKEEDKLKKALEAEERSQVRAQELLAMEERKRPYNSMASVREPTAEEVEAYQMKRRRDDDPMAQFT